MILLGSIIFSVIKFIFTCIVKCDNEKSYSRVVVVSRNLKLLHLRTTPNKTISVNLNIIMITIIRGEGNLVESKAKR